MKKRLWLSSFVFAVAVLGMSFAIDRNLTLSQQLSEIPERRRALDQKHQERLQEEEVKENARLKELVEALATEQRRQVREWQTKRETLSVTSRPLFAERNAVKRWHERTAHLTISNLYRYQEGGANKLSGAIARYLESFTLSDSSIRFDYHNTTGVTVKPSFIIRFFDCDGNFLDSVNITWVFDKIRPSAYRAEVKFINLGGIDPCYYQILEN